MIVFENDLTDPIKRTFILVRPGSSCLYCGEFISKAPYVIWQGTDGDADKESTQVGLHPRCAEALGACLISDGSRAGGTRQDSA